MNTISRTITGTLAIALGLFIIIFGYSEIVGLISGIFIFIIGVFILLNKKEDYIEKINIKGGKKWKIW